MSWVSALEFVEGAPRLVVDAETGSAAPQRAERDACAVVFEGRLHSGQANAAEAVLDAYLAGGQAALRRLDGWFTLVVWDERDETLRALRDPLGTQPLFYVHSGRELSVAPAMEALLRSDPSAHDPNALAIATHLLGSPRAPDETFFSGVSRLPPGHMLTLRTGAVRVERYWHPAWNGGPVDDEQTAARFEEVLRGAVTRCLVPGPAAVFLSGGLDSALVAAISADVCRDHGRPLPLALSALFTGTEADEGPTQRAVARSLALEQLTTTTEQAVDGGRVLGAALELAEEAATPPELLQPIYERLALAGKSRGVAIALSGAGGDEVLMPPAAFAGELFRAFDVPTLVRLGRASLGYSPAATRGSVARTLLGTWGIRPLVVAALRRLAPKRLRVAKEARTARMIPPWLVPEGELRGRTVDHLVDNPSGDGTHSFIDDVTLSYVRESGYDAQRRLGVQISAPLLEPDVVAFLGSIGPKRLIEHGEAKALAREVLASRLPRLVHSWPRAVYADSLWQGALRREGADAWSSLGGTPLLAGLGIVDHGLLGRRIGSAPTQIPRGEAVQVCRALILERWLRSRILGASAREVLGVTALRQEAQSKNWVPMRLDYVGQVAELMRGNVGTRPDTGGGGGTGFNKGTG
jgi:asparagine synthetase B (glutamine-hydrolysing)